MTKNRWLYVSLLVLLAAGSAGCPKSEAHNADAGTCAEDAGTAANCGGSAVQNGHGEGSFANGDGGDAEPSDAGEVSDPTQPGPVPNCVPKSIKKADLLFVVDNSGSMREEQQALRDQIPKLVRAITSGERMPGDPNPFPAVEDLHVAVVSTDMGLIGITGITGCERFGDDGIMRDPSELSCAGAQSGQRFLAYKAGGSVSPDDFAQSFGCLADLGTDGCGFEQQLEAPLKALWPSIDRDPISGELHEPNRVTFLTDAQGTGGLGHGDLENEGFFRNDGETLLGVVVVTDEEDCSSANTRHFTPMHMLSPTDPLYMQDLNLRCFYNKQNLYVVDRYVNALKALRSANEQLVVFAAIAGVPPELVNAAALAKIDFSSASERDAFYDGILANDKMIETPDPTRQAGNGNLMPSCQTATTLAYPPRRLVEVAKKFGENGLVQSICQSDFAPALEAFIDKLSERFTETCVVQ